MADLYEIDLADGIPVAGSGKVKTINSLMEDGGLGTIGTTTDAAIASTDATPVTLVSLLKQLSKTLQDLRADWPDALGAGGGLKVEGSGTPITVTGTVTANQTAGTVSLTTFTCGIVAYAAGDVVGVGGGTGILSFAAVAGGVATVQILTASLEIDRAAVISGETTYRLYLYSGSPPSALTDSAVYDLPSGDRSVFLGYIDFPALIDLGSTLYCEVNNINKVVKTTSAQLYGYLVSIGPFTPTATFYKITLGSRLL